MSFYWRSPYREANTVSVSEAKTSPRSVRSVKSANTRFSEPVSPQDWFDASIGVLKTQGLAPRRGGTIKGILKEPPHNGDTDVVSNTAPSLSVDELSIAKKAKKKVTFGVRKHAENGDQNNDFQASRTTSAHHVRLQQREPMDEFARQNLRKLLGYAPTQTSLPSLSGKAMLPASENALNSANSQSSRAQLRTPPSDARKPYSRPHPTTPSYLEQYANSAGGLSVDGVVATPEPVKDVSGTEKPVPQESEHEPKKSLKRHWTKSFTNPKPTEKKRLSKHLAGRYPMSAGTLHRNIAFRKTKNDKTTTESGELSRDLLKLRITGGDTVVGLTSSADHEQRHWPHSAQGSARSEGQAFRGCRIPSTMAHIQEANLIASGQRLSANQLHIRYGTQRLEGRDGSLSEQQYDKTAQILSWLQDVRQKEGFQPRNSRLYALQLQQQH